jgi:hypothetical protein
MLRRRRPWRRLQTGKPLNQDACVSEKMEARLDVEPAQKRKEENEYHGNHHNSAPHCRMRRTDRPIPLKR